MKIEVTATRIPYLGCTRIAPPNEYSRGAERVVVYLTHSESSAIRERDVRVTIEPIANQRDRQIAAVQKEFCGGCGESTAARIVDAVLGVKP